MKLCLTDNCLSEYVGFCGIFFGITYYIVQFAYTSETFNVSSFPLPAIILGIISELFYCVQGYYKRSPTIMFTRCVTTIAFVYLLMIWLYDRYVKKHNIKKA